MPGSYDQYSPHTKLPVSYEVSFPEWELRWFSVSALS